MHIELECPRCRCHFASDPDASAGEVWQRMTEQGPWFALGEGATFEDMVYNALTSRGVILCPECGAAASVCEESLGRVTMDLLACW